jgi:hypothetical protein
MPAAAAYPPSPGEVGGGGGMPRALNWFNMNPNPPYFTTVDLPTRVSKGL